MRFSRLEFWRAILGALTFAVTSAFAQGQACGGENVLWSFGNGSDGSSPQAGLITDASGNFYGTTTDGGLYGAGTVFKLGAQGGESILWNLGNGTDGKFPAAGVIMDASGNLYGTAFAGGTNGFGTVFEVTPQGSETILWNFGIGDGQGPRAGLLMDASGNLYGMTSGGGANGGGIVFELVPPATGMICP